MASQHVMYGVVIHDAIAKGDLAEMKKVASAAEKHIREHGDVSAALQSLKIEIAKAQAAKAKKK